MAHRLVLGIVGLLFLIFFILPLGNLAVRGISDITEQGAETALVHAQGGILSSHCSVILGRDT